jgi:ABC-type multidrug transport system permease subunit
VLRPSPLAGERAPTLDGLAGERLRASRTHPAQVMARGGSQSTLAVSADRRKKPVLAYEFPLLSLFWAILIFILFLQLLFAVIWTFIDNFKRTDHSGWAKAGWMALLLMVPFFGMLIYVVARPDTADAII